MQKLVRGITYIRGVDWVAFEINRFAQSGWQLEHAYASHNGTNEYHYLIFSKLITSKEEYDRLKENKFLLNYNIKYPDLE